MKNNGLYIASDGSRWRIISTCPPIPTRLFDWEWSAEDFDGPGDERYGNTDSREHAQQDIEEHIKYA